MAKKLNTSVHAVERNDKGEVTNSGVFGPDDDLSKPENTWVEKAITNPDVWDTTDSERTGADQPVGNDADGQTTARRRPSGK
jgi:hypothetical protein